MAFLEERLSTAVVRGTKGGPRAKRIKTYTQSGRLVQLFEWDLALHTYDAAYGIKQLEDYDGLLSMWHVVMFGPFEGFRVRDWLDYRLDQDTSELVFVSGSDWQIHRKYSVGATSVLRPIYKPNADIVVYRDRAGVISVATATVSTSTGLATISGHLSGDTYSCAGTFDVPVTFSDDDPFAGVGLDGNEDAELSDLPPIMLEELKLS
jgi:uncharacterized protein (TIGR02217 family)